MPGEKERAAGREDPSELGYGGADVVDHLQRLRADDAVETVRSNFVGVREVGHDRHVRIRGHEIEDVAAGHALAAERPRIPRVAELEHPSVDVVGMGGKEPLDVVAVDGRSALEPEVRAHRLEPAEAAEANPTSGAEGGENRRSQPSSSARVRAEDECSLHAQRFSPTQAAKLRYRQMHSTSRKPERRSSSSFHAAVAGTSTPSRLMRLRSIASREYPFACFSSW